MSELVEAAAVDQAGILASEEGVVVLGEQTDGEARPRRRTTPWTLTAPTGSSILILSKTDHREDDERRRRLAPITTDMIGGERTTAGR